ncbi:immunity 8 family protein [Mumia sp. zg.B21]|uniref:Imm8 family immunity protein n=1 Tax=Mumia sp. zg.B21 TaxID=2855447 RepID=UPI001C6EF76F|nr:Imm8 family immunity protein [Mumia sp. zg.B21]MBW9210511.1 immunity 8 family protein [Mumia sp. zg.B21]
MRAAVRSLLSFDVDELHAWAPDSDAWALGLRVVAGPDDGPGEESFDVTVCSVAWLTEQVRRDGVVDGRHHLIVEWFDWRSLRAYIERRVHQCEGATWREVAEKLARFGYWEFEDYQP